MKSMLQPLLAQLTEQNTAPCCSLYLPTHRTQPERRSDPTHFRALVREVEDSLAKRYHDLDVMAFVKPLHELEQNEEFWNARKEGIACFLSPTVNLAVHLERPVPQLAVVANSFHIKPLLRIQQTLENYTLVAVSRDHVRLYTGDRDSIRPLHMEGKVPLTLVEALGEFVTEPTMTMSNAGGAGGSMMRHMNSSPQEQKDLDTERFFRAVDAAVIEHVSRPSGLPVILAGLPEHISLYHRISHDMHLLKEGIGVNADALSERDLNHRAWEIIKPYVVATHRAQVDAYRELASKGRGVDDLREIVRAAVGGRVDTLMIEADRVIPGTIDRTAGTIRFDELSEPDVDDVLDDCAELVLRTNGNVLVLPTEYMPTTTGAAATLRW
jgi:hypothetical protein